MSGFARIRRVFLKWLALVYLVAFASLYVQIPGLIGPEGVLPAEGYFKVLAENLGPRRFWEFPTLAWLNASEGFLKGLCAAGIGGSALLFFGVAPIPVLFLLWAFYLSLATAGQDFMGFQWDNLLLECGFFAMFIAPPGLRPERKQETEVPRAGVWLMRWILFRLMFESGCVKLLSGDATWRSLAALDYHYYTQPLPTWTAWYAHYLPSWFQRASTAACLAIELAAPLMMWFGARLRTAAFLSLLVLQILIAATGNYCFFNLLSAALCLFALDDEGLFRLLPGRLVAKMSFPPLRPAPAWQGRLALAVAAVSLAVGSVQLAGMFAGPRRLPAPAIELWKAFQPWRTINNYGLFAVMTTVRPEIIVEGSADGKEWSEYGFRWKPGRLGRRPEFVAPHQPRLDWQMWFAALGNYQQNPWFLNFLVRLLQGSPQVLGLVEENPFPEKPPKYVRARVYDYKFSRKGEAAWWRRELKGDYCPAVSLSR